MSIGMIASQAFSPNKIAGLNLDLDASDLATIIDSGGFVSQWNSKSGSGGSVTQFSGGLQPSTGVNTLNGKNVLNFPGSIEYLEKVSFTASANLTLFIASKIISAANASKSILSMDATNDFQIDARTSGLFLARFRSSGLGNTSAPEHSSSLVGVPSIINYRLSDNDSNVVLRVDGVQSDEDTYNGALDLVQNLYLGRNRGGTQRLEVDMGQVIIYNRDLTLSEMVEVETYLSNKWGIALA